jgi:hypothetical protein
MFHSFIGLPGIIRMTRATAIPFSGVGLGGPLLELLNLGLQCDAQTRETDGAVVTEGQWSGLVATRLIASHLRSPNSEVRIPNTLGGRGLGFVNRLAIPEADSASPRESRRANRANPGRVGRVLRIGSYLTHRTQIEQSQV